MSNQKGKFILYIALGLISGVIGSFVSRWAENDDNKPMQMKDDVEQLVDTEKEPFKQSARTSAAVNRNAAKLTALEFRLNNLAEQQEESEANTSVEEEYEQASAPVLTPEKAEELRDTIVEHWNEQLNEISAQPVDEEWAHNTAPMYQESLELLAEEGSFVPLSTDCKTTHCTSNVEFPSYDVAQEKWGVLLRSGRNVGCATEVIIPEPHDPSLPYQASVVYDCSRSRGESS